MKPLTNFDSFRDEFDNYGLLDHFSPDGLRVLFDDLQNQMQDSGVVIKVDPIDLSVCYAEEDLDQVNLKKLHRQTHVLGTTDETVIYTKF